MSELKDRIRAVRKHFQLTIVNFAKELAVSQSHVSMLENGQSKPSSLFLKALALRFSVNEHWLLTGEGEMFKSDQPPADEPAPPDIDPNTFPIPAGETMAKVWIKELTSFLSWLATHDHIDVIGHIHFLVKENVSKYWADWQAESQSEPEDVKKVG